MSSHGRLLKKLGADLRRLGSSSRAKVLARFFKTGKGEYAQGDIFLGVMVSEARAVAKKYATMSLPLVRTLLQSKIHEERLVALLILVAKFEHADKVTKKNICRFYLAHTRYVNNWDLVDLTAHKILGEYLFHERKTILYRLAKSGNLWERRIAIISTFAFIKQGNATETLKLAQMLFHDAHDLIHTAVGWMLREVGKKCGTGALKKFLRSHYRKMPRTMLRYAIERFPENTRRNYLVSTLQKKAVPRRPVTQGRSEQNLK